MRTHCQALVAAALLLEGSVMAMPIPPDVKQSVAFIYVKAGSDRALPNGTAFFYAVPDASDSSRSYVYLVTAAHVLRQRPHGPFFPEIFVRLNQIGGGTDFVRIPLMSEGPQKNLYLHPDPNVDLAAIPFAPDPKRFSAKFVAATHLPSADELKAGQLAEGADIFFAGLFTPFVSDSANIPVIRFGRVALVTSEPIPWDGSSRQLLLVECLSYGGNSGAPVFYYLGSDRDPGRLIAGPPELKLAGIMMGAYQDVRAVQTISTSAMSVSTSNLGIAAVVPADKLRELIEGPALVQQRALALAAERRPGT